MAVYHASGYFTGTVTNPGYQACVDLLDGVTSFRPKFIMFFGHAVRPEALYSNVYASWGFWGEDALGNQTQFGLGYGSRSAQSSTVLRTDRFNTRAWRVPSSTSGTPTTDGIVASVDGGGFTPQVTQTWGNADIYWIAFGGDDVEAQCTAELIAASASSKVLSVPFAADVLFAGTTALTTSESSSTAGNATVSIGWAARDGGAGGTSLRQQHGASEPQPMTSMQDSLYKAISSPTTDFAAFDVSSWGSSSITLACSTPPTSEYRYFFCAVKGLKALPFKWNANELSDQVVSLPGVKPRAVLLQSFGRTETSDVISGDVTRMYGYAARNGERGSSCWTEKYGTADTFTRTNATAETTLELIDADASTVTAEATIDLSDEQMALSYSVIPPGPWAFIGLALGEPISSTPVTVTAALGTWLSSGLSAGRSATAIRQTALGSLTTVTLSASTGDPVISAELGTLSVVDLQAGRVGHAVRSTALGSATSAGLTASQTATALRQVALGNGTWTSLPASLSATAIRSAALGDLQLVDLAALSGARNAWALVSALGNSGGLAGSAIGQYGKATVLPVNIPGRGTVLIILP